MLCLPYWPAAQTLRLRTGGDIPVNLYQNSLAHPWTGGLNAAQVSNLDLDRDGTPDLLIFDREGDRWLPFVHDTATMAWRYTPAYLDSLPAARHWALWRDYDGDGLPDLFCADDEGGIRVFRQQAGAQHGYMPYLGGQPLQTIIPGLDVQMLDVLASDIPVVEDLDNDGDLDILTFDVAGIFVEYHRNVSVESYGHSDSLVFLLEESCWGHFKEDDASSSVLLDVFCKGTTGGGEGLHAGSAMLALDLDGDGDKDLLLSDIGSSRVIALTNGGTPVHADIVSASTQFPASNPVNLDIFPALSYADVDNDGLSDLLASPNDLDASDNTRSLWYYRNTGTAASPVFSYLDDDLLQGEMLDVGSGAVPVLVDYNLDGLQDLVVANYGYYDFGELRPQLMLLRNIGSDTLPRFDLITEDLADLAFGASYVQTLHPAFADLDGDGDVDMLLGKSNGRMDYYRNTSSSSTATLPQFVLQEADFQGIDVGGFAAPQLFDLSGDGLPDLLVGERDGNLNYCENTGTAAAPVFALVNEHYGDVQVSPSIFDPGYSVPWAGRHQGRLHVVVGTGQGRVLQYAGVDTAFHSAFGVPDTLVAGRIGRRLTPAWRDLDDDGWPELLVGNFAGGINLFTGLEGDTVALSATVLTPRQMMRTYPNPTDGRLTIVPPPGIWHLELLDLAGHRLYGPATAHEGVSWDLRHLPSGSYVLRAWSSQGGFRVSRVQID
ncbi:MAG: hypothetical protein OHK0039_11710 [Bacteroidia bacterium]